MLEAGGRVGQSRDLVPAQYHWQVARMAPPGSACALGRAGRVREEEPHAGSRWTGIYCNSQSQRKAETTLRTVSSGRMKWLRCRSQDTGRAASFAVGQLTYTGAYTQGPTYALGAKRGS